MTRTAPVKLLILVANLNVYLRYRMCREINVCELFVRLWARFVSSNMTIQQLRAATIVSTVHLKDT